MLYFVYYALLGTIVLIIFILTQQTLQDPNIQDLQTPDQEMYSWFEIGQYFSLTAILFYAINMLLVAFFQVRRKAYMIFLCLMIVLIKIFYYCWTLTGLILYFTKINDF
jgi:hypothetical protein